MQKLVLDPPVDLDAPHISGHLSSKTCSYTTTTILQIPICKQIATTTTAPAMVLFENVQAMVIRYDDKKPYHEYNVIQQPTERSQTLKEAYIEVVSGERFAVRVDLLSTFDFQSAPDVRIRWQVDGMGYSTTCISRKQATSTHMGTEIPTFQPKTLSCGVWNIDGKWMKCGMVFADLQLAMRS